MSNRTLGAHGLILLSFAFQSGSVIFSKYASLSIARFNAAGVLLNPFYMLSLGCLGLQALVWPQVLKCFPLFYAYIFMSALYPAIMAISFFVFGEKVTAMNCVGSLVIMGGIVVFVSGSGKRDSDA
jgi:hypothetical protein